MTGSLALDFGKELVVDLFAGGGGASLGISWAYREPDVAVNHSAIAIAVHEANHTRTDHYIADVYEVDPQVATGGRPVGVLWASPDCRHHSKAKGGKPRSKKIRGLAWVVVKWAATVRPRIICLENVEEFADWGPLLANGQPCPVRKGMTFRRWKRELEKLGYVVEFREMVAADYGVPTIRKRLYLVARCDGRPIVWPERTHHKTGADGLQRWLPAADCIDFGLPARSIFGRPKPLARNTQKRIAKGLWRYVLNTTEPFIVGVGGRMGQSPERGVSQSFQTITAKADSCLAQPHFAPFLTEHANGSTQRVFDAQEPLRTQVAQIKGGHFALSEAALAPVMIQAAHGEGKPGGVQRWGSGSRDALNPLGTATGSGGHAVAAASLVKLRRNCHGADLRTVLGTITAGAEHHALSEATMVPFIGTNTTGHPGADARDPARTLTTGEQQMLVAAHLTHLTHQGDRSGYSAGEPTRTVTGAHRGEQALVSAHLTAFGQNTKGTDLREPAQTAMAGAPRYGLVSAYFEQANGGFYDGDGRAADDALSTITASGTQQRLVQAYLVKYYSEGGQWQGLGEPMHTVPTKDRMGLVQLIQVDASGFDEGLLERAREVAAFLHEYLPEHFPEPADVVLVNGYLLVDITLRMLTPRELARAQGFPDSYVLEWGLFKAEDGKVERRRVTKTDQVRLIGNSVCPLMAKLLIQANASHLITLYERLEGAAA